MKCIAVIPARYASKRLPGKPLLRLGSKPIIQHVYERTSSVKGIDRVLVATDDGRIFRCVEGFGGEARMTSPNHQSGSDRVAEAIADCSCDWVFNVQGDEPFIDPETLRTLLNQTHLEGTSPVYTAAAPIRSREEWSNPSVVKVVVNHKWQALYFSRWPIPYVRQILGDVPLSSSLQSGLEAAHGMGYLRHIGIYLYRREFLLQFVQWLPGPLELAEELEQLRILENGHTLAVVPVKESTLSIDTPQEYELALRRFEDPKHS